MMCGAGLYCMRDAYCSGLRRGLNCMIEEEEGFAATAAERWLKQTIEAV